MPVIIVIKWLPHSCKLYSITHDPARKAQKKKEQEEALEKHAIESFTPGTPVVCRWGAYTYEGVIAEQRLEEKR
jgi:hypothetical protein